MWINAFRKASLSLKLNKNPRLNQNQNNNKNQKVKYDDRKVITFQDVNGNS